MRVTRIPREGEKPMAEFVYQLIRARKAVHDKVILDDVTVGVYPGAKIGVVGPNGAGKSTLLKVMAGLEDVSNGEAMLSPGYTVGILQQEPPLDEDKTVRENIELAFGDLLAKIERFNQVSAEMADPDAGPGLPALSGDGRAAVPGPGRARLHPLRRRAPSRGSVQAAA